MVFRGLAGALLVTGLFSATASAQSYVRQVEPTPDQLNDNVRGQFIRAGDVSPEEYARLLEEADKIRAYQGNAYSYNNASDITTYSVVDTPVTTTQVYDGRPTYSGTTTEGFQIELYDEPIPVTTTYATTTTPVASTSYTRSSSAHTVVRGDTLYSISKRYGVSLTDLKSSNGLSGNTISIGQVLSMPGQRRSITQPLQQSQSTTLVRNVEPIPFSGIYAVLPGDTLYSIARRACVSVNEITSSNGLGSNTTIVPGQRLSMPSGHCLQ